QISSRPDVSRAAKSGEPSLASFRPTLPVLVPIPAAQTTSSSGVTDVQASTEVGSSSALETRPDARQSKAPPAKELDTNIRPQQMGAADVLAAADKTRAAAEAKAKADAATAPAAPPTNAKPSKKAAKPKPPVRPKLQKPSKPKKQKAVLPSGSTPPAQTTPPQTTPAQTTPPQPAPAQPKQNPPNI
ncbi:MAG: hypothetical protein ABSE21_17690, partial [Bryobacteraceae bacterium]